MTSLTNGTTWTGCVCRLALLCAVVSWFPADELLAVQRTFVSAASGNDANPCSRPQPCRNFAAAIVQTDANGEVVALDSGGYGVVTIAQSVSLVAPKGVHAGITAFSGTSVTVNAGNTAQVSLTNLSLHSLGGATGIDANTVSDLYIDHCAVNGFTTTGILFDPTNSGARLHLSDSTVENGNTGIRVAGPAHRAALDSVQLINNHLGLDADGGGGQVTVRKSIATGTLTTTSTGGAGFYSHSPMKLAIEDSVATLHDYGFYTSGGGIMIVTRCAASSNTYGLAAFLAGSTIYVSDSTIAGNGTGVGLFSSGIVISRDNNTLQANTNSSAFSGTFPQR
jgi:parallel beta helix pectate lyase-like protein